MISHQVLNVVGGLVALAFGLHAIVTQRVTLTDENDDADTWLYGRRAVAIGCLGLVAAAVFFASAGGYIDW